MEIESSKDAMNKLAENYLKEENWFGVNNGDNKTKLKNAYAGIDISFDDLFAKIEESADKLTERTKKFFKTVFDDRSIALNQIQNQFDALEKVSDFINCEYDNMGDSLAAKYAILKYPKYAPTLDFEHITLNGYDELAKDRIIKCEKIIGNPFIDLDFFTYCRAGVTLSPPGASWRVMIYKTSSLQKIILSSLKDLEATATELPFDLEQIWNKSFSLWFGCKNYAESTLPRPPRPRTKSNVKADQGTWETRVKLVMIQAYYQVGLVQCFCRYLIWPNEFYH
ncbi:hypothetical protein CONCODRAFT_12077 [Conidiobolus coronatus NRRL 28638]|uniref:Uncharacterized protein n=1 Tax=Conidiobolus coronatus (strain ATCC 28846 / CBS 209.66 / NRRL 28638) TaxID=796925 RepID=A0A137NTQ1_CONC2|nr:hypothetical protein CONCODRAFT_12077 [Conidiobolus coronatus NRRL 28638]|eukprot:KXN66157.1 hypothetical protein CONCODRAFT_12077 [Conidiobolus coronatus NRRL 28638]